MSTNKDTNRGICILSLDNGGPGTYSQLLIIKEYMYRLATDLGVSEDDIYPADYFDLMGGVGFGGLAAILLGYLRMNVQEAIDALLEVALSVFPEGSQQTSDPVTNSRNLKESIESLLQARGIPLDSKMNDPSRPPTRCRVVLYAATTTNIAHPHIFRTYRSRGSGLNPTIVEAICATISIPSHFSPVLIGPRLRRQGFIGGSLGANNPTRELLEEASIAFGRDRRVAQVISIGYGTPQTPSIEETVNGPPVRRPLRDITADCHMVARDLFVRLYRVNAYCRFSVEKGTVDMEMDDWSTLGDIEAHTTAYITNAEMAESLEASLKSLRNQVGTVTLGQLNQSNPVKLRAKTAPSVSPFHVVRQKEWNILIDHLDTTIPSRKVFCITGMGGCGKTELVSYFIREKGSRYSHIVYVDAASAQSAQADLEAWVQLLSTGHERDTWEDALRILAAFSEGEPWILILDNADNPTLNLVQFIPKCSYGTIIITSRNPSIGGLATAYHLKLGEMTPDEAMSTLLCAARRKPPLPPLEMESARALLGMLGDLPLAIAQAGTYCHTLSSAGQPYTFTQYKSLFVSHRPALMKKTAATLNGYQLGTYTALDLSYQAIPQHARGLLHLLASFHPSDIPLEIFSYAAAYAFADPYPLLPRREAHPGIIHQLEELLYIEGGWSEMGFQEMLHSLRSFSMISISAPSDRDRVFLHMHPLVNGWARDMLISDPQYRMMAIQVLTSCSTTENFYIYRYLLPHINDLLDEGAHVNDNFAAGVVLKDQAHYDEAERLFLQILDLLREASGYDNPDAILVAEWLASAYHAHGKWTDAETLQLEILGQRKKALGNAHPDTFSAAAHLADIYREQGRWKDSEQLELDVLTRRRNILGEEHPDTIAAAIHLASTYMEQGRWKDAKGLQSELLEKCRRIYGLEHPTTTRVVAYLATTYRELGEWNVAEKLEVEVLERRREMLGQNHLDTIAVAVNLATTYGEQGRWGEAEKLQSDALERREKILGLEHPETIGAAAFLATIYGMQGRSREAERLQEEVLDRRRRLFGIEHPRTIAAAESLASTYSAQERREEAEALQTQVLEQRKRILGMSHPDTCSAAAHLAATHCEQGRWKEAETLQWEALEQRREIFGREHPRTTAVAENLVATYCEQEKWEEAIGLQVELLEVKRGLLGDEDPRTMRAAVALASTYHSQGRLDEAEELKLELLHRRRIISGENHPSTILASYSLIATRKLHEESKFVRKLISAILGEGFERNQLPLLDIAEEPRLWYDEVILSPNVNKVPITHKGHSYRLPLVALNLQLSETSIVIGEKSTFGGISSQLYSAEESALPVALEQISGPYPRWRIPKVTTKVPRSLQKLYIADISKPFTLALVRGVDGDHPLLIDISSSQSVGTKTVGDVIGEILDGRGHTWSSIRLFSGPDEIQGSPYTLIQKEIGGLYSTVFFVLMNNDADPLAYSFHNEGECMTPLPLRIVFFQSQRLVDSAPRLTALTLPAIHLSRALHHLVLSLAEAIATSKIVETMEAYFISRLNSLVSELKAIFRKIENLVESSERTLRQSFIQFFYELCEEQPGVVSVRQSFESFKAFILDGQDDSVASEYFPPNSEPLDQEERLLTQAETPSVHPEVNGLTELLDSSSGYDGESSVGSVEQLVEMSEAVDDEQKLED